MLRKLPYGGIGMKNDSTHSDDLATLSQINNNLKDGLSKDEIAEKLGWTRKKLTRWLNTHCIEGEDGQYALKPDPVPEGDVETGSEITGASGETDSENNPVPEHTADAEPAPVVETGKGLSAGSTVAVPIDKIVIGERFRKDPQDIPSLADSIAEVGLLHPPVITPDKKLVCGYRRIRACEHLGWTEVPVRVVDIKDRLRGEYDENALRRDFLPSEMVAITEAMRKELESQARRRRLANLNNVGGVEGANCPDDQSGITGRTSDILAERAGVSRKTLEKAREVVQAAQDDATFSDLVQKMDSKDRNVNAAWNELKKRQRLEELRADTSDVVPPSIQVIEANPISWLKSHKGEFDCLVTQAPSFSEHGGDGFESYSDFMAYTQNWLAEATGSLAEGGVGFIACRPSCVFDFEDKLHDLGYPVQSIIVWHHPDRVSGKRRTDGFPVGFEVILHIGEGAVDASAIPNGVITANAPSSDWTDGIFSRIELPQELVKQLLAAGCKPKGRVLDPFAYSGYTGLACLEVGRECTLIEQDAELVKIIGGRLATAPETDTAPTEEDSADQGSSGASDQSKGGSDNGS